MRVALVHQQMHPKEPHRTFSAGAEKKIKNVRLKSFSLTFFMVTFVIRL